MDPFFKKPPTEFTTSVSGTSLTAIAWSGTANTFSAVAWNYRGNDEYGFFYFRIQIATTVNSWWYLAFSLPSVIPVMIGPSGGGFIGGGVATSGTSTGNAATLGTAQPYTTGGANSIYVSTLANTNAFVRGSAFFVFK
jgi:hypothetical protein